MEFRLFMLFSDCPVMAVMRLYINYIDNIVVYTGKDGHMWALKFILWALARHGWKVSPGKCIFITPTTREFGLPGVTHIPTILTKGECSSTAKECEAS